MSLYFLPSQVVRPRGSPRYVFVRAALYFSISDLTITPSSRSQERKDAGAQSRAAKGYWPRTRMLLVTAMWFIGRDNAVSASRCSRTAQKVRPPGIFKFDLTPLPRHHLYSCRTQNGGCGLQGYGRGSTLLTTASNTRGHSN